MELHLTSEQALLRDSAAKFIAAAGPKVARGFRGQDPSFAPARLRQAGELGWLGMLVPSSMNGLDLGLTELALVLEQAGRGLVCEPIGLAAISAAALALGRRPHPMLEPVMTGAALVVPALEERAYGDDPLAPRTRAAGKDGALRLTGQKMFVCADGADGFLVSAGRRDGPVLCYVAHNAPGCTLSPSQTAEGRKLATLSLADAPGDLIAAHSSSRGAVDVLYNLALLALSSELLGTMERAKEITLDYLRIRKQFGKLIGSFHAAASGGKRLYSDRGGAIAGVSGRGQQRRLPHRFCDGRRGESQGVGRSDDRHQGLHPTSRCDRIHRRARHRPLSQAGDAAVVAVRERGSATTTLCRGRRPDGVAFQEKDDRGGGRICLAKSRSSS